jgi:hypothetical protein
MAESSNDPKEVVIFTEVDKDYRIVPSNGVWVGTTTRLDFLIDFFVEQLERPESVTYELEEGGRFQKELGRTPAVKLVRKFQIGVLTSPAQAEALANAILDRLNIMKKNAEK